MNHDRDDGAWFAPKRFGYGSSWPIRWQGWAAIAIFAIVVAGSVRALHGIARPAALAAALIVFMLVCAAKTRGGWRWRWGRRDS
jgi:hypothetical protein